MTRPMFDHQAIALHLLRQSLKAGHKRPMIQAPTGFGKTRLGAAIVEGALRKGRRVVFTVPSISLIDQTVEAFGEDGITEKEIGVMQADHPLTNFMRPIQIASVQTLEKRELPYTDIVVVDEAHRAHQIIFKWMAERPELPFVGLSASPWTRGLGKHYDDLIVAATTKDLIAQGFLSPYRVFAPSHPDLSGVATVNTTHGRDYSESQLGEAMDKPELTADIVSTWLQRGENRPTLCFAVNRAHARSLEQQFQNAGVTTAYVDAFTERNDRNKIGEHFDAGRVKVVVNVGCLTTGVDWDVRCLILARPTKSEILYVQIIGRALRTADGKDDALILDHSDTTLKLGFVDSIHHDTLDDGKPKPPRAAAAATEEKVKLPKECASPTCDYVKPAGVHKCPACGFEPVHRQDVIVRDGDLVQLAGMGPRQTRQVKQKFWSGLLWYCRTRSYSRGWASHKYREKFGVWPQNLTDIEMQPDADCRNFVKAGQIKFAKGLEASQRREAANA